MVGPGPQEARNLVEQVVGQVQGMLPEGLELAATIARYEPGMNVRSLVDRVRASRAWRPASVQHPRPIGRPARRAVSRADRPLRPRIRPSRRCRSSIGAIAVLGRRARRERSS